MLGGAQRARALVPVPRSENGHAGIDRFHEGGFVGGHPELVIEQEGVEILIPAHSKKARSSAMGQYDEMVMLVGVDARWMSRLQR
jgi:hypothetical protein